MPNSFELKIQRVARAAAADLTVVSNKAHSHGTNWTYLTVCPDNRIDDETMFVCCVRHERAKVLLECALENAAENGLKLNYRKSSGGMEWNPESAKRD